MNKKLLFIILPVIFSLSAPSILAETVNTSQQTIANTPATAEEYFNRGNAYKKQGNLTQAIADYTKAISMNSKHAKAYYNRGNTYGKQGNLIQAITDYTSVIEIDSQYAAAYCNRGNAYQTQGNFQQAIADYNKAIEINPDIAGFYSNRGRAYQIQDNLHQAIVDYNKAIELNPNDNAVYYNRGLAYYGTEQYKNSLADYKIATSNNPNKEAYDDFIKYVPVKKASDTGNVRNEILQLFAEKPNLDKKPAMPVMDSAPFIALVAKPFAESAVAPGVVAAVATPVAVSAVTDENLAQANSGAPPAGAGGSFPKRDIPRLAESIQPLAGAGGFLQRGKKNEIKSIPEEDIRNLVNIWAISWQAGDMKTYRGCYASNFQSKGMNLDVWTSHKADVRQNSKNINIRIDNLQISADKNIATAVFTQHYSSSTLKSISKKKLELRKINNEWKIYREII
jgi:tetratricopeptide (TPR) repeat protein